MPPPHLPGMPSAHLTGSRPVGQRHPKRTGTRSSGSASGCGAAYGIGRTQPRGMATFPRLVSLDVWPPVVTVIAPTLAAAVAVRPEATDGL